MEGGESEVAEWGGREGGGKQTANNCLQLSATVN